MFLLQGDAFRSKRTRQFIDGLGWRQPTWLAKRNESFLDIKAGGLKRSGMADRGIEPRFEFMIGTRR